MDSRHRPSPSLEHEFGDVEHARQTATPLAFGILLLRGGSDGSGDKPHRRRRRKKRSEIPGSVNDVDSQIYTEADADPADGDGSDDSIQVKDEHAGVARADANSRDKSTMRKKRIRRRVAEVEPESSESPTKRKKRKRKVNQVDDAARETGPSDSIESNLPSTSTDEGRTRRKRRKRSDPKPKVSEDPNELEATIETATGMRKEKSRPSKANATTSDVNGPGANEDDDSTKTTDGNRKKRRRRKAATASADEGPVADGPDDVDSIYIPETDEEKTVPEIMDATESVGVSSEPVILSKRKKRRRKTSSNATEQDESNTTEREPADEGGPSDDEVTAAELISIEASVDIPTEEIVPESIDSAIELDDSLSSSDEAIDSRGSLQQLSVRVSLEEEEAVSDENAVVEEVIEQSEEPTVRDEETVPPSLVIETSVELPGEEVVPESIDAIVDIDGNIPVEPLDQYSEVEVPDTISVTNQDAKEDETDEKFFDQEDTSTSSSPDAASPDADDSIEDDKEPSDKPDGDETLPIVPAAEVDEPDAVENVQEDLSEVDIKVEDGEEVDADADMTNNEKIETSETVSVAESLSSETVDEEAYCEDTSKLIEETADDEGPNSDRTVSPPVGATEEADPHGDVPEENPEESVAETAKTKDSVVEEKTNDKLSDEPEGHSNTSEEVVSITEIVSSNQDPSEMDDDCLKISVVTWNLAEKAPPEEDAAFFRRFRKDSAGEGSDLVLIGAQECEEIKPRRAEGHRSRHLRRMGIMMLGKDYVPLAIHSLGGIQCALYCHRDRLGDVEMINIADVTCGVGNVLHNKGAIGLYLKMKCNSSDRSSRILLVTGHLAAHVKNVDARNADFHRIVSELEAQAPARFLRPKVNRDGSPAECDGRRLLDSMDHVFFAGDLNYRVDLPREHVEKCILDMKRSPSSREKLMRKLLRRDQLLQTIASGQAFAGFDEGKITFLPTFKFDKGSSDYDTSAKQRVPAWTDRILFRAKQKVKVCEYESVADAMHSDHRPVLGSFQLGWGVETEKKKARKRRRSR